ncbi:hypothetical protein LN040_00645 [Desulfovibrio subterraneus]|jgi:hypothetical protein|uniref:Uncharacterized protein n=1 Tax=Desulfovibrio subterraneus TaxID=2718620 RepID=A0A7J0BK99_9BACT|nr:hypothetical protein [Desulfovibrio subterraneus]WBF67652.1 hypothetical protein LN040_00645 [Desulfovibrio subterraneus]GFM33484.1 hypothetical protein DSM101010T_18490 [Desulfovibrio subterraneus]
MSLFKTLENVFAAVAFAEKGDFETAIFIASGKTAKEERVKAQPKKQADKRARLRA